MSDGLAEVNTADDSPFGYDRVQRAFAMAGAVAPAAAVSFLLAAADAFRGDEPLRDDLALVVVRAGPGHTRTEVHKPPASGKTPPPRGA